MVVCDQWLGSTGYAGLKALRRAGWAVSAMSERDFIPLTWRSRAGRLLARTVRPFAIREFNRELVSCVSKQAPEFLLIFKGAFILDSTLREIRELGVRCYCFYPDVSFMTHGKYLPKALPNYDWIFTTKRFGIADLRTHLGITRASVLWHAYDADLHRPIALSESDEQRYGCDVSFIGTWSPKKEELLHSLVVALPMLKVRIWGDQWRRAHHDPLLARAIMGGSVTGEDYIRAIVGSSINLGILSEARRGSSAGDATTTRTFEIPASGGFMLHERTEELHEIFSEDVNVVCYGSVQELVRKVETYLPAAETRAQIAQRGRVVVQAGHSWDHRIREILAHHSEQHDPVEGLYASG